MQRRTKTTDKNQHIWVGPLLFCLACSLYCSFQRSSVPPLRRVFLRCRRRAQGGGAIKALQELTRTSDFTPRFDPSVVAYLGGREERQFGLFLCDERAPK